MADESETQSETGQNRCQMVYSEPKSKDRKKTAELREVLGFPSQYDD